MKREIERKFLVRDESWRATADGGRLCCQGYLCSDGAKSVRVRILGAEAFLSVKGPTEGCARDEFEYAIPLEDARALFRFCGALVEKTRYLVSYAGMVWELDVFAGDNMGLVVAEIELDSEEQSFEIPPWVEGEVTGDPRYYNGQLARMPFSSW